jgi:hypothetical protein
MMLYVYINCSLSYCEFRKLKTPVLGALIISLTFVLQITLPPSNSVEKLVIAVRLKGTEKR